MTYNAFQGPRVPRSEIVETFEEANRKARLRIARPDSARDRREAQERADMLAEMKAQLEAGTLSELGRRLLEAHLRVDGVAG